MPVVPIRDRSVSARALPGSRAAANASPESFGAGRAGLIGQVGQSAGKIAQSILQQQEESKLRKDKAVARDAYNEAMKNSRDFMGQIYRSQGKDAIDAVTSAEKQYEKLRNSASANFENDRQRDYFLSSFDSTMRSDLQAAFRHQEKQREVYEKATLVADNQNAVEDMALNYLNPDRMAENEAVIRANTRAEFKGLGPSAVDKAIEDRVHDAYSYTLETILSTDPQAAKVFLEENSNKFKPQAYAALQKEINTKAKDAFARDTAIRLSHSGLGLEEQLAEVDKINDPDLADEVRSRVKMRDTEQQTLAKRQQQKLLADTWAQLRDDPKNARIPYESVSATEAKTMERFRDSASSGYAQNTDWAIMGELASMSDAEFKELSYAQISDYRGQLEESDWDKIFNRFQKLKADPGKVKTEDSYLTTIRTNTQMLNDTTTLVGIEKTSDKYATLARKFQEEVTAFERLHEKSALPEEKQKILDRLVIAGEVRGGFFRDPDKFLFEVKDGEEFFIDDIPKENRRQIIAALKSVGRPVTQENIERLYTEKLLNG